MSKKERTHQVPPHRVSPNGVPRKGYFSISAVSHMFNIHQQTIRMYEKQGLIHPERSAGNTRLFTEEAIAELEEVIYLTHQLGVNLAGVEIILKLKKEVSDLQAEINAKFTHTQEQLARAVEGHKAAAAAHAQELKARSTRRSHEQVENTNTIAVHTKVVEDAKE